MSDNPTKTEIVKAIDTLTRGNEIEHCGYCKPHPVNDAGPCCDYGHGPDCPVWLVARELERLLS